MIEFIDEVWDEREVVGDEGEVLMLMEEDEEVEDEEGGVDEGRRLFIEVIGVDRVKSAIVRLFWGVIDEVGVIEGIVGDDDDDEGVVELMSVVMYDEREIEDDEEGLEVWEGGESEGRGKEELFEKVSIELRVLTSDEGEEELTINI